MKSVFNYHLHLIKQKAEKLVIEDNSILKTDIANDLVGSLDILWKLRTNRNDDLIDILNLLQGVLKKEIFENFSEEKINGIFKIIMILQSNHITSSDVSETLEILSKSGFNPWRPLSNPDSTEN